MKNFFLPTTILLGIVSSAFAADLNTARIDELTGLKGKMNQKEGVYKVTFPRNDVKVVVDGWTMPPFMGLGTWAAFTKGAHTEASCARQRPQRDSAAQSFLLRPTQSLFHAYRRRRHGREVSKRD